MKTLTTIALGLMAVLGTTGPAAADDHADFGRPRPRIAAATEPTGDAPALAPMPAPSERATTIFGLPKNVGPGDRVLRTIVGLGLAGAGIYGLTSGDWSDTTSGVLLGVSAVPFATAATGYCPLYQVVGIERSF